MPKGRHGLEGKTAYLGAAVRTARAAYNVLSHPMVRKGMKRAYDSYTKSSRASKRTFSANTKRRGKPSYRRKKRPRLTNKEQRTVRRLQRKVDRLCTTTPLATHVRRQRRTGKLVVLPNKAIYGEFDQGGTLAEVEAAMSSLRYFDPSTNDMKTANPASGTYNREMCVSIFRKIKLVNNYRVPVQITVYSCVPKKDTGQAPSSFFLSGLVDQGIPAPSANSPLVHFSDSHDLKDMYAFTGTKKILMPARSMVVKAVTPEFKFDFGTADAYVDKYQRSQGAHIFVIRMTGMLGHSNTQPDDNYATGFVGGVVDICMDVTYKFMYDAGKDVHEYSLDDTSFTIPVPLNASLTVVPNSHQQTIAPSTY